MRKNNKKFYLTSFLMVIFVLLLSLLSYYLLFPIIKSTKLYTSINNYYQENTWTTYNSKNAKFSFKHPLSWPISWDPYLEYKDKNRITPFSKSEVIAEYVKFSHVFEDQGFGFILVQNQDGINTLDDYIKSIYHETEVFVKGRTVKIPVPVITPLTIGGEKAITVGNKSGLGTLSPTSGEYIIVKNGLVYRFVATVDNEKDSKIFQEIINSVKFTN